jgi:hypothetical protein
MGMVGTHTGGHACAAVDPAIDEGTHVHAFGTDLPRYPMTVGRHHV